MGSLAIWAQKLKQQVLCPLHRSAPGHLSEADGHCSLESGFEHPECVYHWQQELNGTNGH